MTKKKKAPQLIITLHHQHNRIIDREYNLSNIRARRKDIKEHKPVAERDLRLKLFKQVDPKLFPPVLKAFAKELANLGPQPPLGDFFSSRPKQKAIVAKYNKWSDAKDKIDIRINKALGIYRPNSTLLSKALHAKACDPACPYNFKTRDIFNPANYDSATAKYRLLTPTQVKRKNAAKKAKKH